MTNLQTVSPKTPTAESARTQMGNFFQMPTHKSGGNLSNADFDSFLGNRESKNQSEEAQAEQQAAKNRKKPIEVALATPPSQEVAPLQELKKADILSKETQAFESKSIINLNEESLDKNGSTELSSVENDTASNDSIKDQVSSESAKTAAENQDSELSEELEETVNQSKVEDLPPEEGLASKEADFKNEIETPSESRGMESAPLDGEMIATTTLESAESSAQPLREPAITTINRLTAFSSLDRSALAPVAGSETSNESGLGNTGGGLAMPTLTGKIQSSSPAAQAAGLFKSLAPELDKFKQTGRSQIQLDLPVGENESVRIRLSIRGTEIRSTFITESPELREALQKAWPEFSQSSRDRGFRLGDPAFQQSYTDSNTNLGQNNRRQADSKTREPDDIFSSITTRKPLRNSSSAPHPSPTALWA